MAIGLFHEMRSIKLIHVEKIRCTVACDTPKRYAISLTNKHILEGIRLEKNSFSGINVLGAPQVSSKYTQVVNFSVLVSYTPNG